MNARPLLLFIFVVLAGACSRPANSQNTPQATVRPTLLATTSTSETPLTPTIPSSTESIPVPSTIRPTSSPHPTATRPPTSTSIPSPTPTSTPVLPSESIVFVRDDILHQWSPQANEVRVLAENVDSRPVYSADFAAFVRTIVPEQEYALTLFHLPTQREVVWATLPYQPYYISISPNGRWATYIAGESWETATLVAQEIMVNGQQLSLTPPVLTVAHSWKWPDRELNWATADQLSWSNSAGVWLADLNARPITPVIAIQPSTNTYPMYPIYQTEGTPEPTIVNTLYVPYRWSPDGRYLLVVEQFFEEGVFRVVESGSNRSFEIPDSGLGPISDEAVWLDETTLLHLSLDGSVKIWRIHSDRDPFIILGKTIEKANIPGREYRNVLPLSNNHVRFSASRETGTVLYDLDLETGELVKISSGMVDYGVEPIYYSSSNQYALWSHAQAENGEWSYPVFLDDLNGDAPTAVTAIFGPQSCCWYWLQN